ncbi:hypothetical protein PVAP13_5KG391100 [Panicum virgatum]|uniref:Uncharacterized protein n=1 Tax=Panicum virgatum TaxID=38727 RepID=A0A8T0SPB9_PANVG|nr:hypothetical protein PVAP13_5KG391100 [Panicum virgatum]
MEGSIGSRVCRGVRSCWMGRRSYYQRLPASRRPAGRGVRLGRLAGLFASTSARGFGRLRRAKTRWPSPLRLLRRVVDACVVGALISRPLRILRAGVPVGAEEEESAAVPSAWAAWSSPPTKPRREESPAGSRRRRGGAGCGGRGVMLNICVAEALLLRRGTSEVRRSPLQRPREAGRCAGVRACSSFQ